MALPFLLYTIFGYEEYVGENKPMSCYALNLLMPDFSGTMLS